MKKLAKKLKRNAATWGISLSEKQADTITRSAMNRRAAGKWVVSITYSAPKIPHAIGVYCDGRPMAEMAWSPESEANARLIAAAPDLLAAFRVVASVAEEALTDNEIQRGLKLKGIVTVARAAIAKAEGRTA